MATPLQMRNKAVAKPPETHEPTPVLRVPHDAAHRKLAQETAPGLVEAVLAFAEHKAPHHPQESLLRSEIKEVKDALASVGTAAYNIGIVRIKSLAILLGMELGKLITDAEYYINKVRE